MQNNTFCYSGINLYERSMGKHHLYETEKALLATSRAVGMISLLFVIVAGILIIIIFQRGVPTEEINKLAENQTQTNSPSQITQMSEQKEGNFWKAPVEDSFLSGKEGEKIRYGKDLIAYTSVYLGPKGKVAHISNGMNCQNCHLDAGRKTFGNNYSAVASTYPKFRARSGTKESIEKRINDCFERSLNGKPLKNTSKEMIAMVAYMKWLGSGVKKGESPEGVGLQKLAYLNRAANPTQGAAIFQAKCISCHGKNGEGLLDPSELTYTYPPLWGEHSYNDGAGLYRIGGFAGYVKNNMPFGATHESPQLSDEEAWDVAAFVNSQPRPHKDQKGDYKELSKKPIDFPFGPYADEFSQVQHKFGPFGPIAKQRK